MSTFGSESVASVGSDSLASQFERSLNTFGNRSRGSDSHERTNELTKKNSGSDESSRNATRAGGLKDSIPQADFQRLAQALYNDEITRAPVIRRGEREPISALVRQLVYRRDAWTCQICGAKPFANEPARRSGALHLDHIIPWSAGGKDRSDNLRTLCGKCNTERSNYVSSSDKLATPVVRICVYCLSLVDKRIERALHTATEVFPVYCGSRSHHSYAIPGWRIL